MNNELTIYTDNSGTFRNHNSCFAMYYRIICGIRSGKDQLHYVLLLSGILLMQAFFPECNALTIAVLYRKGWLYMIEIGSVVWGVQDIHRAVQFWSEALHYKLKYPASDDLAILIPISGNGIQLSLNRVSSPKAKRHHIGLFTDNQKDEVERLIALGATRKEWRYEPGADYVVLNDPDGNPFCVVQQ